MKTEKQQPQPQTFDAGIDFLQRNHAQDNFFLQIETFDPHEPFFSHRKYKDLYPHNYSGRHFDWPEYRKVKETVTNQARSSGHHRLGVTRCGAGANDAVAPEAGPRRSRYSRPGTWNRGNASMSKARVP